NPTPTPSPSPPPSPSHGLSKAAIAGIVVGSAVGLAIIAFLWYIISKRVQRRRQERRQSQMTQFPAYPSGYSGAAPVFASPDGQPSSPTHTTVSYGPPPPEMPSENKKPYPDYRMSLTSGNYDPHTSFLPTEGPA